MVRHVPNLWQFKRQFLIMADPPSHTPAQPAQKAPLVSHRALMACGMGGVWALPGPGGIRSKILKFFLSYCNPRESVLYPLLIRSGPFFCPPCRDSMPGFLHPCFCMLGECHLFVVHGDHIILIIPFPLNPISSTTFIFWLTSFKDCFKGSISFLSLFNSFPIFIPLLYCACVRYSSEREISGLIHCSIIAPSLFDTSRQSPGLLRPWDH